MSRETPFSPLVTSLPSCLLPREASPSSPSSLANPFFSRFFGDLGMPDRPRLLAEARKMFDLTEDQFWVMRIGETQVVKV